MAQDHYKPPGNGGRYYKDDLRRQRKYYNNNNNNNNNNSNNNNANSYASYSSYSSYSSNPNPFPSNQYQQHTPNPFLSRRTESGDSSNNSNWYPQKRSSSLSYHGNNNTNSLNSNGRPSISHQFSSRRNISGSSTSNGSPLQNQNSYRDDLISQQHSSNNNGYEHSYPNKKLFNKSKYGNNSYSNYSNKIINSNSNGVNNNTLSTNVTSISTTTANNNLKPIYNRTSSTPPPPVASSSTSLTVPKRLSSSSSSSDLKLKSKNEGHELIFNESSNLTNNNNNNLDRHHDNSIELLDSSNNVHTSHSHESLKEKNNVQHEPKAQIIPSKEEPQVLPLEDKVENFKVDEIKVKIKNPEPITEITVANDDKMDIDEEPTVEPPKEKTKSLEVTTDLSTESQPKQNEEISQHSDDEHSDIEGCIFPMLEHQYRAWVLKHRPKSQRRKNLKYLNKSKLESLSQYNFLEKSILIFQQADAYVLFNALKENNNLINKKIAKLTDHYIYANHIWKKDVAFYDKQLEKTYENETDDSKKPVVEEKKTTLEPPRRAKSSRRSRHHGDSVRTEAEFMDILASLEQERERDPLVRAQYGAAIIPDMIMDPIEKFALTRKMDSNNLVRDKGLWAKHLYTDPVDTFTEAEHAKFCELYVQHPKKFGRISHDMGGLRTSEECVLHYYKTKKTANYKQLIANKNKKSKKKPIKKKKDSKSANTSRHDTSTPDTSNVEHDILTDKAKSPSPKIEDPVENKNKRKIEEPTTFNVSNKQRKISESTSIPISILNNTTETDISNTENSIVKLEDKHPINPINSAISTIIDQGEIINRTVEETVPNDTLIDDSIKKVKRQEDRHISSYWSVQDITNFPLLLQKYGSNWDVIADEIGTKSATMVKNYYQRGLVEHPYWQSYISGTNREALYQQVEHQQQPQLYPQFQQPQQQQSIQNVPPTMGYFYKPTTSYATSYPRIPQQMVAIGQQLPPQPVHISTNEANHLQQVPHFVPIGQNAPLYAPYSTEPMNIQPQIQPPQGPMPIQRNGMMNMSSLLNANTPVPSPQQPIPPLPPLNNGYTAVSQTSQQIPVYNRGPSIMNLLNNDDTPSSNNNAPQAAPFKPNISNIMNSPETSSYQFSQSSQVPSSSQQTQQQQRSTYGGGTSALDALARIAFERK